MPSKVETAISCFKLETDRCAVFCSLTVGFLSIEIMMLEMFVDSVKISNEINETKFLAKSPAIAFNKPWSLAEVTFENGLFVHQNLGSFFKRDGAEKEFILAIVLELTGWDTFDDYT